MGSEVAVEAERRPLEVVVRQDGWGIRLDVQYHHLTAWVGESLASSGSPTTHDMLALPHRSIRVGSGLESAAQQYSYPYPVIARLALLLPAAAIWSMLAAPVSWRCHIHGIA